MRDRGRRWLLGLLTAALVAGCSSTTSTTGSSASSSPASASASTSPHDSETPESAVAPAVARRVAHQLLAQGTGSYTMIPTSESPLVDNIASKGSGTWDLRRSAGSWEFEATSVEEGTDYVLRGLTFGHTTYAQVLAEDSIMAPDCWFASDTGVTVALPAAISAVLDFRPAVSPADGDGTMLTIDVMGAVGLTKAARTYAGRLRHSRVEVSLLVEGGALGGWAVTDSDLAQALTAAELDDPAITDALDLLDGTTWRIRFSHVGEPVTLTEPAPDRLLGPGHQRCTRA